MDYFLARLPIFRKLPEDALAALPRWFKVQKYARGQAVFADGERPDYVYLLRSGLVKAVKHSPSAEPVTMELIVPGGLFGMIAVMDKKPYPVSAVCVHDSEAYQIPAARFAELLGKHSDVAAAVYAQVGSHLRHSQALRALAKEPVDKRVAYILYLLSESLGKELRLRREDVAEMAGATPETAIRVLGAFKKKGLLSSGWKRITVLKREKLKELAEQE